MNEDEGKETTEAKYLRLDNEINHLKTVIDSVEDLKDQILGNPSPADKEKSEISARPPLNIVIASGPDRIREQSVRLQELLNDIRAIFY